MANDDKNAKAQVDEIGADVRGGDCDCGPQIVLTMSAHQAMCLLLVASLGGQAIDENPASPEHQKAAARDVLVIVQSLVNLRRALESNAITMQSTSVH